MKYVIGVGFILGLISCASTTPFSTSKLDSEVGQWSYQNAVKEYGPPNSTQTLPNGTMVATWIRQRSVLYELQQYDPKSSTYVPAPPAEVRDILKLTFDSHQILQSWSSKTDDPGVGPQTLSSEKKP